jgi:Bacterial protein of unknown function (DUF894).
MLPLYVRDILHLGAKSMGGLMAISGSGAFLGSIGCSALRARIG